MQVSAMERRISTLTLLCLVLSGVGALDVNIPKEVYEYARGDNITLPCSFKPKTINPPMVIISWSAEGAQANAKETLILTYYSGSKILDIKSLYEGRVGLDVDVPKGKADLKLSSITLAENKVFECRVQIPGDDEGKPADTARVVVLVAPSTPICKIEGKAEYGQNINLTCRSEEGSPPPTYKWDSRDVRNVPRVPLPRSTDTSMNIGSTAGIIGGVVAALIVLIIIIYCCCCRKKKKEEEYTMGVRGEEYSDKEPPRNGESRRADGQEDNRGYDDRARSPGDRSDRYEERSERNYENRRDDDNRGRDYDDRRSDYDDRRSDYDDRRSDYDDRRSDYDDRRSDYTERRDRYSDRNERYDDEGRYEDDRRYNDDRRGRRNDDDRYDEPYDDRDPDRPLVPANKPPRKDYDV
ncbi:hypothetical protein ABVT39_008946 [Epinephelus coioides]